MPVSAEQWRSATGTNNMRRPRQVSGSGKFSFRKSGPDGVFFAHILPVGKVPPTGKSDRLDFSAIINFMIFALAIYEILWSSEFPVEQGGIDNYLRCQMSIVACEIIAQLVSPFILKLILMLSGDVETNPGPGYELQFLLLHISCAISNSELMQLKLAALCVGLPPKKLDEVHDISDFYSSLENVFGPDDAISILYLCLMEVKIDAETVRKFPVKEKILENWRQKQEMKFALLLIGICNQIAGKDCKLFVDLWKSDIREKSEDVETLFKYLFQHKVVWLKDVKRLKQVLGNMGNQVCIDMVENYQCSIKPLRQETPLDSIPSCGSSQLPLEEREGKIEELELTDEQMDRPIEERDMFYLSRLFGSWKHYAGVPGLGLSNGEQYTILANRNLIDNAMRVLQALTVWQHRNPLTATFRNLLNIVLELRDGSVARNICQYITSKPSSVVKGRESDELFNREILDLVDDETILNEDDLADVSHFLTKESANWQVICTKLHVKANTIEGLANSNKDNKVRLNDGLTAWLRLNYDYTRWGKPTWRKVAHSVVGINNTLVQEIASKYSKKET